MRHSAPHLVAVVPFRRAVAWSAVLPRRVAACVHPLELKAATAPLREIRPKGVWLQPLTTGLHVMALATPWSLPVRALVKAV